MPWLIKNLFTEIFKQGSRRYVYKVVKYALVTIINICITYCACLFLPDNKIWSLIVRAVICCVLCNALFFIAYCKSSEFKEAKAMVLKIIHIKR